MNENKKSEPESECMSLCTEGILTVSRKERKKMARAKKDALVEEWKKTLLKIAQRNAQENKLPDLTWKDAVTQVANIHSLQFQMVVPQEKALMLEAWRQFIDWCKTSAKNNRSQT
jgi:hypothetical protein